MLEFCRAVSSALLKASVTENAGNCGDAGHTKAPAFAARGAFCVDGFAIDYLTSSNL